MRILLTNGSLAQFAGTELYTRDVALELRRQGHEPSVFSPLPGPVADQLRDATIPVALRVEQLGVRPDVIHGQHHVVTMSALLAFPGVPAVSVCHGWRPWEEAAPLFPRVRRYVAVDEATRDRLVSECGVPEARARIVPNFVDLERFRLAARTLPDRPRRALLFSNYATEGSALLTAARNACQSTGCSLCVIGARIGTATAQPECELARFDVVFAQGRSALEALAVGSAVIVASSRGLGPLVTSWNLDALRRENFGSRSLCHTVTAAALLDQLDRFDADDARVVTQKVRNGAGAATAVAALVDIYGEAIAEQREAPPRDEQRVTAAYLQHLAPHLSRISELQRELNGVRTSLAWRAHEYLLRFRPVRALQQALARWIERHSC